jgi:ATP-binding protein involved in chromosome partitioning
VLRAVGADGARETALAPAAVRRACRCAACVDERTGRARLDPASVSEGIEPAAIAEQGNYAVAISWSDGHATGIFTFEQLGALAAQAQAAPAPPR